MGVESRTRTHSKKIARERRGREGGRERGGGGEERERGEANGGAPRNVNNVIVSRQLGRHLAALVRNSHSHTPNHKATKSKFKAKRAQNMRWQRRSARGMEKRNGFTAKISSARPHRRMQARARW